MKRNKKTVQILLGVLILALAAGILCLGLQVAPTVDHALRIAELIGAQNQTLHFAASAELDGRMLAMEGNVYWVTEDGSTYLVLEQGGQCRLHLRQHPFPGKWKGIQARRHNAAAGAIHRCIACADPCDCRRGI